MAIDEILFLTRSQEAQIEQSVGKFTAVADIYHSNTVMIGFSFVDNTHLKTEEVLTTTLVSVLNHEAIHNALSGLHLYYESRSLDCYEKNLTYRLINPFDDRMGNCRLECGITIPEKHLHNFIG
ncbi:MAG: hypothetical protein HY459_04990 [Parcubacteria group bacterium]|nr:hypothetical protein [Parcubacteria group bacterium]